MNYEFLGLGYKKYKDNSDEEQDMNEYSVSWEELTQLDTDDDFNQIDIVIQQETQNNINMVYEFSLYYFALVGAMYFVRILL